MGVTTVGTEAADDLVDRGNDLREHRVHDREHLADWHGNAKQGDCEALERCGPVRPPFAGAG